MRNDRIIEVDARLGVIHPPAEGERQPVAHRQEQVGEHPFVVLGRFRHAKIIAAVDLVAIGVDVPFQVALLDAPPIQADGPLRRVGVPEGPKRPHPRRSQVPLGNRQDGRGAVVVFHRQRNERIVERVELVRLRRVAVEEGLLVPGLDQQLLRPVAVFLHDVADVELVVRRVVQVVDDPRQVHVVVLGVEQIALDAGGAAEVVAQRRHAVPPLVLGGNDEIVFGAAGMIVVAAADPVADERPPVVRPAPDVFPAVESLAVAVVVEDRGHVRLRLIVAARADQIGGDEGEARTIERRVGPVDGADLLDVARIDLAEQRIHVLDRFVLGHPVGAAVEFRGIVAADAGIDAHPRGAAAVDAGQLAEQVPGGGGFGGIDLRGVEAAGGAAQRGGLLAALGLDGQLGQLTGIVLGHVEELVQRGGGRGRGGVDAAAGVFRGPRGASPQKKNPDPRRKQGTPEPSLRIVPCCVSSVPHDG